MKLPSDLNHAARSLLKEPGFAMPAILMLGLGLGATSVVFSLVNGVLLKPLPYAQPDRLVSIHEIVPAVAQLYLRCPSTPATSSSGANRALRWKVCPCSNQGR